MNTRFATFVFVSLFVSASVSADFADFSSQLDPGQHDPPKMTADFSGGSIDASVSSSYVADQIRWQPVNIPFENPAFANMFGDSGHLIQVVAQPNVGQATRIDFHIDRPFPANARLIVFDMDGVNERVTVASTSAGAFAAPAQMESNIDGGDNGVFPSAFPIWNADISQLKSTGLNMGQNHREANIFDIGGRSHVSVTISSGELASSWVGIATTVPEPASASLIFVILASLGMLRRRVV